MEKLLELKNISKSYSGVEVLKAITIDLEEGEVLCLVGENGAGKSTLIKIISGAVWPDAGTIRYFGKEYGRLHPKDVIDMGVATIYQEIDLVDNLTVAENIFLGAELKNSLGIIRAKEQERQADELLEKLRLDDISGKTLLSKLSTAQKQCVQIVKALKNEARILILDEPTASLGDTLLILKDGCQTAVRKAGDTTPEQVIHDMIGRDASSFYQREYFQTGDRILRAEHYANRHTVHDVSFEMKSGEVFGLGGLVGAGRTELVRMLYGADARLNGRLYMDGKEITPSSPRDAISKGIFMISEDRKGEGLLTLRSVKENIMITHNEEREWISLDREARMAAQSIENFAIKTPGQDAEVTSLSGGNQQKTIIARCVTDPGEVYIFDEPTKGVDVGAKEEIYRHILNLAKADKFVILISSDMPELLSMSDRIGVMCGGRLVDIVDVDQTTESDLMRKYLGLS
ncbi:MAG: sugar ABC transporter ATP-binding protein [Lachnospiraceae bacterium]|nr:sugar ABC transporter ATP-binding protein [Lachnospiraceae bacterium]